MTDNHPDLDENGKDLAEKRRQIRAGAGAWEGTDMGDYTRELRERSRERQRQRWGLDERDDTGRDADRDTGDQQ